MININDLKRTLTIESKTLAQFQKELLSLPEEQIRIRRRNGRLHYSYYSNTDKGLRQEKYLSASDEKLIALYLRARYLRRLVPALSAEINIIKKFIAHYDPDAKFRAWTKIPTECRHYVKCEFMDNNAICKAWAMEKYDTNPYVNAAGSTYLTNNREAVRSKNELISANILRDLMLCYRYECKLVLKDGEIYPDFTIIHPETLEIYYVEIFGMMDVPEYAANAFKKIKRYADNGLSSHLICLFDHKDAPLSTSAIRSTFESIFKSK